MYSLTIDPGTHIGYAVWKNSFLKIKHLAYPAYYGAIQNADEEIRIKKFKELFNTFMITDVYIENSALMKNSTKGIVTAESGALVKLSQTIGRILQISKDHNANVELVTVMRWKGTLPKDVCERRIRRILPDLRGVNSHVIDAIGIGLSIGGHFR